MWDDIETPQMPTWAGLVFHEYLAAYSDFFHDWLCLSGGYLGYMRMGFRGRLDEEDVVDGGLLIFFFPRRENDRLVGEPFCAAGEVWREVLETDDRELIGTVNLAGIGP